MKLVACEKNVSECEITGQDTVEEAHHHDERLNSSTCRHNGEEDKI